MDDQGYNHSTCSYTDMLLVSNLPSVMEEPSLLSNLPLVNQLYKTLP